MNYIIRLKLDFIESSVYLEKEVHKKEPIQVGQMLRVCGITYYVSHVTHVFDDADMGDCVFVEAYSLDTIKRGAKDLLEQYSVAEWEIKRD